MGDYDSMGPSLQLFGATFLNFSYSWLSHDFEVRKMLLSPESTLFYVHAGRGYKLVIVIAGRPQQAVHAGGDDRQPPCGAVLFTLCAESVRAGCCHCCYSLFDSN